jgi:SHOCT-like domain/Toastrack DUF4097
MSPRLLTTSDKPEVSVDAVYGNLQVEGWERAEILLRTNSDETAALRQEEQAFHVTTTGDCLLHLPYKAKLTVVNVHGGAHIKMMEAPVITGRILGSLAFDEVSAAQVESVYGELLARGVTGDLTIDQVLGNAWIEEVKGNCSLERVAGDLDLRNMGGDVRASARGDARVQLETLTGTSYKIEASGDITFSVAKSLDAKVQISSRGNDITLDLPDGKRRLEARSHELTLGNGTASILLTASGHVSIRCGKGATPGEQEASQTFDRIAEDFSQKISGEVESHLESQMKILDEQMAHLSESIAHAGVAPAEADRIMRRARETSERANLRAQEKMQRAREKLDRKLAAAQRKVEEHERAAGQHRESQEKRNWSFEWSTSTSPAQRETEASDEERLMILRMLEQKKINLAEAEQLLEALEGNSG